MSRKPSVPAAINLPSGEKATVKTLGLNSLPMSKVLTKAPSDTRQIFTLPSAPPEASRELTGENRTLKCRTFPVPRNAPPKCELLKAQQRCGYECEKFPAYSPVASS